MIIIYHNPHCSKSRACLSIMQSEISDQLSPEDAEKTTFKTVKYIDNPIDFDTLTNIIKKLGITPIELIRKNETIWEKQFKGKEMSDANLILAMITHPELMERPIVVNGNKAVIGRPPSRVLEIL